MHDELERTAESPSQSKPRLMTLDAGRAIAAAESLTGAQLLGDVSQTSSEDALWTQAREAAAAGKRVAIVLRAEAIASAREALRKIAQHRLAVVAHAVAGHGSEDLAALCDLGWGVLSASGPEDSFDLSLVARRAAEDSGVPFVVVHSLGHASAGMGRAVALAALPTEKACKAFVGPSSRVLARHDPAHPSMTPIGDRAFAERVPFALGSALREYGDASGRRHDVFDKTPLGEPALVLVGMGPIGDALVHAVPELRARGYDVGAIHVTTLRPFPGARLVKALARALAVTVLEPADEPLGHGGLLARELKCAFTDALTWAPGFPGIGRIPKLFTGVTGLSFDVDDLASICDNMLADERGKRSFSFSDTEHSLPRSRPAENKSGATFTMRWVLDDVATAEEALDLAANVLANALGLRVHAIVTTHAAGATVDLQASREHARGGMARRAPRLVLASERGALSSDAITSLASGSVLGVLVPAGDAAGALPDAARAVARERRVRVIPLVTGGSTLDARLATAVVCVGAAAAVASRAQRTALDGVDLARTVATHLAGTAHADVAAERAKRAFEATIDVATAAEADLARRAATNRDVGNGGEASRSDP